MKQPVNYVLSALSLVVAAIGYLFFELQFALTALLSFVGLWMVSFLIRDLWGLFRLIAHEESLFRSVSQNEGVAPSSRVPRWTRPLGSRLPPERGGHDECRCAAVRANY